MLYEILKTSKLGASFAPDMYTALWAQKLARDGEVKTLSGAPPLSFQANGTPLLDYLISGNTVQSGTPTPDNPIMPQGTGDLETSGTKAGQYKIPISSANATTPVYLGEVQTTRNIKKLVFDGTENFTLVSTDTNRTVCKLPLRNCKGNYGFCTHILWKSPYESSEYNRLVWTTTSGGTLFISLSNEYLESQTVADLKTYLQQQYAAGTPVTVWYVLATPTTGIVSEPLRKIGDYADTVSMEQAGVQIPTARDTNTLDVLTDVKPSEVYIKYKS